MSFPILMVVSFVVGVASCATAGGKSATASPAPPPPQVRERQPRITPCELAIEKAERLLAKRQADADAFARTLDLNRANAKASVDEFEVAQKAKTGVAQAHLKVLRAQEKLESDNAAFRSASAEAQAASEEAQIAVDEACPAVR